MGNDEYLDNGHVVVIIHNLFIVLVFYVRELLTNICVS